jgi:MEKHLA domain
MPSEPYLQPSLAVPALRLITAYESYFGEPLVPPGSDAERLRALWEAPFFALTHGGGADPKFEYGNKKAQELWELPLSELVGMPSRLSAAPDAREARAELLEAVARQGFSSGYSGIRTSKSGRQFRIRDTRVFNLVEGGAPVGQAAVCRDWEFLENEA